MPRPHRRFLEHVASITNIRPYALSLPASPSVRQAYNTVVVKLVTFRDKHIQMVSRYTIVLASRPPPPPPPQSQNGSSTRSDTRVNLPSATSRMEAETGSLPVEEGRTERKKDKVFYGTGDGTKAAARFVD